MDYVIERTHIIDHDRFLRAGVHARDLWEWGMKYSGKHELDGAIPMSAVLASPWGHGGKANIKAAAKLVEVGLWTRTEAGFLIKQWEEQGNKTQAQLEVSRVKWRAKKASQRKGEKSPCPPGTEEGTPPRVLNSPSYSPSSGSDLKGDARGARALASDEPLTDQRRADFESLTLNVPARNIEPEWSNFVDDRIKRTAVFASDGAIDADWRKWVRRENAYSAKARGERRGVDTRQPLGDLNAKWLKTGSDF